MKGYEWLNIFFGLAIVLLVFFIPEATSADLLPGGMTSCTREPSSIWLRNACHGGFVTLTKGRKKTKVIAQHRGIQPKSAKVELVKESCHDESAGFLGSVTTRLFSPTAQKYVCFSHRGRVLAKSRKAVERLGPLCMFLERALSVGSRHFVQFQSSANPDWYLGFDGKRVIHRKRRRKVTSAHTLPRKMKRHHTPHRKRRHKCDFSFSTGSFSSIQEEFSGLIEHIRKQRLSSSFQHVRSRTTQKSVSDDSKTASVNDIFVEKVSKTSAYYYIESNDERYKPEDRRRNLENDDYVDEEDLFESKISFLNFKSNLKMIPLRKKKSSRSSSAPKLKRRPRRIPRRRPSSKNDDPSHP